MSRYNPKDKKNRKRNRKNRREKIKDFRSNIKEDLENKKTNNKLNKKLDKNLNINLDKNNKKINKSLNKGLNKINSNEKNENKIQELNNILRMKHTNFKSKNVVKNIGDKNLKAEDENEELNKKENLFNSDRKNNEDINFFLSVEYDKNFYDISADAVVWDTSNVFYPDTLKELDFLKYYGVELYEEVKENKSFLRPDEVFLKKVNSYNLPNILFISSPDLKNKKRISKEDKDILREIYKNIFKICKEKQIKKLIIPNIRMRQGVLDIETAVDICIVEVINFVKENRDSINDLVILSSHDDEYTYITKYIKENYYNSYNFLKKNVLNISKDSVSWEDRKRRTNGAYPVYDSNVINVFEKLKKYNIFPLKASKFFNILDIKKGKEDIIKYINRSLEELESGSIKKEDIDTEDILKYLEEIYSKEKNHDGIIASEVQSGNFKKALEILIERKRI